VLGAGAIGGLVWATGHHRNGVLLAPLTAELTAGVLCDDETPQPELLQACSPARFAAALTAVELVS
ncbi:MAG TPA: hypothetical protein VFW29_08870, partial [Solirubrobacteraceae bacterium]|nr:hypothetical protein [Solirubrobacteraceae bacterium]